MITKVTADNSVALQKRLEEISKALKVAGKTYSVNNLEEYYQHIEDIATLRTASGDPYKYFLMPLDEPFFEIDANTRKITVPQHFAKNGVGVHGDHMAEVLYFRVDRYFDYQDLYACDDIVINWQFRPANASRNAEVQTYTSFALAPDETYDPGHIVFGWVIGNYVNGKDEEGHDIIAHMTPSRGTLTFSISFLKKESNEFSYMLNTQMASVNIYDSLTIEDPTKLDDLNKTLIKGLVNSSYTPESLDPLIAPIFLSGDKIDDGKNIEIYSGLNSFANFEFNNAENPTAELEDLTLVARAGVLDMADGINYKWTGTDYEGHVLNADSEDGSIKNERKLSKTADTSFDSSKFYYKKVSGGYERIMDSDTFNEAIRNNELIYELGDSITVKKGGSYMVTVSSYKEAFDDNNVSLGVATSPTTDSNVCFIPKAAVPSVKLFVENDNEDILFSSEEENLANGLFKIAEKDRDDQVDINGEATLLDYKYYDQEKEGSIPPELKVNIGIDKSKVEVKTYDNLGQEIISGSEGVTENSSLGFVKLYLTNDESFKPSGYETDTVNKNYIANGESDTLVAPSATKAGAWKVFAVNERNHTFSVSDASNPIYISKVAPKALMTLKARLVKSNGQEEEQEDTVIINNAIAEGYGTGRGESYDIPSGNLANLYIEAKFIDSSKDIIKDLSSISIDVVEMKAEHDEDGNVIGFIPMPEGEDKGTADIYPAGYDSDIDKFVVHNIEEGGAFVLKATTIYHGTKRITLSDPFMISMS